MIDFATVCSCSVTAESDRAARGNMIDMEIVTNLIGRGLLKIDCLLLLESFNLPLNGIVKYYCNAVLHLQSCFDALFLMSVE